MPKNLTYILTEERGTVSFNPRHSDTMLNLVFMENIVGTLVKYGRTGRVENFHAKNWQVSSSGLVYQFEVHDGLFCDDGTPITAATYAESFNRILRLHLREHSTLPVFDRLLGLREFGKGSADAIPGLRVEGVKLVLEFESPPDGLFDFLAMPYYGFYCSGDFDADGNWKKDQTITSSGGWRVKTVLEDSVVLEARQDQLAVTSIQSTFDQVTVRMEDFAQARLRREPHQIINRRLQSSAEVPEGYSKFLSTPTDFVGIVLSPFRVGSFKDNQRRQGFAQLLRKALAEEVFDSEISRKADRFYPSAASWVDSGEDSTTPDFNGTTLKVVMTRVLTPSQDEFVRNVLAKVAVRVNAKLEIEQEDRSKPGWKERLDALTTMDIRVARVDIGGGYEPWVVQMMFCSRLGVSFPDPSGRICALSSNLSDRSPETARKFEQIVYEDSAVIPVFHTSFSWLVSNDLSLDELSPTSNLLRFEYIKPK